MPDSLRSVAESLFLAARMSRDRHYPVFHVEPRDLQAEVLAAVFFNYYRSRAYYAG